MDVPTLKNPFVGPRSFTEDKASWFFGRERELRDLVHLVIAERIVLLYSPSGAGKTSLLQAGLIPALRNERFRVLPLIRVVDPFEGTSMDDSPNRFVKSTLRSLERGLPEDEKLGLDSAALGEMTLKEYLDRIPRPQPEPDEKSRRVPKYDVLIFDQFEEILTTEPASRAVRKLRYGFFEQVADALYDRRWAVFTLREDYVAGLDPYRRAVPTRLANHFRLDLLKRDDARHAIEKPLQVIQASSGDNSSALLEPVTITDDAVSRLLDDLGGASRQDGIHSTSNAFAADALYIEPIHLQMVCERLWDELHPAPGATIAAEQIEQCGDVDAALRAYYDERVQSVAEQRFANGHSPSVAAKLSASHERDIRSWFQNELIIGAGFRGQVAKGEHESGGLNNETVEDLVVAKLVNREIRLKAPWYELAHDRFVDPVRASNASWSSPHLNELQRKSWSWDHAGRPATGYLGARGWVTAKWWSRQPGVSLRDHEQRFLDRSGVALLRQGLFRVVPLAAVVLLLLVGVWMWQEDSRRARDNAITNSNGLANTALFWLPQESREQEQLDLGLLLAVEALDYLEREDIPPSSDALRSLLNGLVVWPYFVSQISAGDPDASNQESRWAPLAISPDGRFLATTGNDGRVALVDLPEPAIAAEDASSTPVPSLPQREAGSVTTLAFSDAAVADAVVLAVGGAEGEIDIWDVTDRDAPQQLGSIPRPDTGTGCDTAETTTLLPTASTAAAAVTSLTFGGEGQLAAGYADGTIGIWDLSTVAEPIAVARFRPTPEDVPCGSGVRSLAFVPVSGDDDVIASYANGSVWAWIGSTDDGEGVKVDTAMEVDTLAISPDGQFLVFGGSDGLHLHRPGKLAGSRTLTRDPVTGMAFNPRDATALFSSHASGEIVRWDLSQTVTSALDPVPERLATVSEAGEQSVLALAFAPDGRWLVSLAANNSVSLWSPLGLPPLGQLVSDTGAGDSSCVVRLSFAADENVLMITDRDGVEVSRDLDRLNSMPGVAPEARIAETSPTNGSTPGLPPLSLSPQAAASTPWSGVESPEACHDGTTLAPSELEDYELDDANLGGGIVSVALNRDETLLAAGRGTGEVLLLTRFDGAWVELGRLPGHLGAVTVLEFHPINDVLASADATGAVVLWSLEPEVWIELGCARSGRSLTNDEIRQFLNRNPEEWESACSAVDDP